MTMPKKGLRKITVDGAEYKYVVKPLSIGSSYANTVTIQNAANTRQFITDTIHDQVTPKMIEDLIRNEWISG